MFTTTKGIDKITKVISSITKLQDELTIAVELANKDKAALEQELRDREAKFNEYKTNIRLETSNIGSAINKASIVQKTLQSIQ